MVPRAEWLEERMDVEDLLSGVEAVYSDNESDAENEEAASVSIFPVTIHKPEKVKPEKIKKSQDINKFSYPCEHCPNVYSNRGALWQHSVATHSVEKTCECKICGRKFYRNCSLALHMKSHSEEEYCQCKECGKSFNRLSNLERHMKVAHVDAELFPCPTCDKVFRDKTNLSRHIATHTNPTKFQCDICNKSFKSQEHLTIHFQTVHINSETLTCSICGDVFSNVADLMQHDAMHALDKPQVCRFCGLTFSDVNVLRKHIMSHTGEQLTCKSCGIVFSQRSSLLRHIRKMHSNEPDAFDASLFLDDGTNTNVQDESENGSSVQDMTDQEEGSELETEPSSTSEIRKALGSPIKSGRPSIVEQNKVNTKINGLGVSLLKPKQNNLEVSLIPIAINNHLQDKSVPNYVTKPTNGLPISKIVIGGVTITAEKTNGSVHNNKIKDNFGGVVRNGDSNDLEDSESEDSEPTKSDNEESSQSVNTVMEGSSSRQDS